MTRLLVIEDEPRLASFVTRALQSAGYGVDVADDGRSGLTMALTGSYAVVILDLTLPSLSGEGVLQELLAEQPGQQVLILSARSDVSDRVRFLELGAADYVTKPFVISELIARVGARVREIGAAAERVEREGIRVDTDDRSVDTGNGPIRLTNREYRLLRHLKDRPGKAVSRQELLADVWGMWFDPGTNVVEVTIGRIRHKLGPEIIETVRGVGYRISS
ncbi:MAG TPA: response regulator transcription factor [Ilumatobacteraceae bacterium]|jgi:DNA-binding response OmpR family regulator